MKKSSRLEENVSHFKKCFTDKRSGCLRPMTFRGGRVLSGGWVWTLEVEENGDRWNISTSWLRYMSCFVRVVSQPASYSLKIYWWYSVVIGMSAACFWPTCNCGGHGRRPVTRSLSTTKAIWDCGDRVQRLRRARGGPEYVFSYFGSSSQLY
jgi:hypothetical protein